MREPDVFVGSEAVRIGYAVDRAANLLGGKAVALILLDEEGILQVCFAPGNELACWTACNAIDWDSIRPIVSEWSRQVPSA
jgi:hypothetical protein